MSLSGVMSNAVSALQAQSAALSTISSNLANSGTTGYKAVSTSFADLMTEQSTSTSYSGGGVVSSATQSVTTQGSIESATSSTDLAIDGSGLFVVSNSASGGSTYFTRDGEFTEDSNGYLELNGEYYLMGWPTDSSGNVSSTDTTSTSGLEAIDLNRYSSSASATTDVSLSANLPASASSGASYTSSISVYDSLGTSQTVPMVWTKSSTANEWTLTIDDPENSSGTTTGTASGTTTYDVTFNTDGTLSGITDSSGNTVSSATISVGSWTDGASASSITLDLGSSGSSSGLTQYTTSSDAVSVSSSTADGYAYGTLSSVAVGTDGTVTATYSNGKSIPIYKVAIATFANEDGLSSLSGDVYQQTSASGAYTLSQAGSGGAGSIEASALESSTVDTSTEFSKMITAQQAYSAAAQLLTAANSMYQDLESAVR